MPTHTFSRPFFKTKAVTVPNDFFFSTKNVVAMSLWGSDCALNGSFLISLDQISLDG